MSYFKTVELKNLVDSGNSTTTPLSSGQLYTGDWVDTSRYGTATVGVVADQDSAEDGLCICYSDNGTTEVQNDKFTILANNGKTFSVGMANRYLRITYTNGPVAQTNFSIQTILKSSYIKPSSHRIDDSIVGQDDAELVKAILTGIDQNGYFVNIEASSSNSLKTSLVDQETGNKSEIEPLGSLKTVTPIRLVGTTFSNGTKDPNFWTETVTGTGSVTQAGEITLATGTTADSTAKYETTGKARKITGTTNQFRAVARNVQSPADDCIRRIGPYSSTEGYFMQFDGTVFGVGSRKSGVDTVVTNGNFNGNLGATIDFEAGIAFTKMVIDYTALGAKFFIDGSLIHKLTAEDTSLTTSLNLPASMEIINENGNTTNNSFEILFATILRLGELETEAIYKFISTNTTTVCKYNAGRLIRITNVDNAGSITVYDNTSATGTVIATVDTGKALGTLEFGIPFSTGLTVVTSGGAKVAVIYE